MMPNVEHFEELSPGMQDKLLAFIQSRYTKGKAIDYHYSAYGLKQAFTREVSSPEHVTEQCFTEAMVASGFTTKMRPQSNKACFNIYVLKHPR